MEIIFLNDFRWHPKIIVWADFLQALEGDTVHLPAPKNICSRDLELNKDMPFFTTSDTPLVLIKAGAINSLNTRMMNVRWRFYHFWNQIPQEEQQELITCGRCFAKFILNNASDPATATWRDKFGSSRALRQIISRLYFSLTFQSKVKLFSDVFCEAGIAIVVQKTKSPLILC